MMELITAVLTTFDAAAIGDVLEAARLSGGSVTGGVLEAGYNSR